MIFIKNHPTMKILERVIPINFVKNHQKMKILERVTSIDFVQNHQKMKIFKRIIPIEFSQESSKITKKIVNDIAKKTLTFLTLERKPVKCFAKKLRGGDSILAPWVKGV